MFKKYLKVFLAIFVIIATFINFIGLSSLYLSYRTIKNQSIQTQELAQQLNFLKQDILVDDSNIQDNIDFQSLTSSLQDELQMILLEQQVQIAKQSLSNIFTQQFEISDLYNIKTTNNSLVLTNKQNQELLSARYDDLSQSLFINSLSGFDEFSLYQTSDFESYLKDNLTPENLNFLSELQQNFQKFELNSNALIESSNPTLQAKSITFDKPYLVNGFANISFLKSNQVVFLAQKDLQNDNYQVLDKFDNQVFQASDWESFSSQFTNYIAQTNFYTDLEENVLAKIDFIKKQLNNDEFLLFLRNNNLIISEFIDDPNQFLVSILQQEKTLISLKVDKKTGKVTAIVLGKERVIDFQDLDFQTDKPDKSSKNYLLLGKHGSLTDTIIIANFNPTTQKIKMVSLPRDLYIDNKKINSLHMFYGPKYLMNTVEKITGLKIDNYALIDMYAFVDVVDYLGGIDVELKRPLVDPSYKTFDNQQWGYLNLPAGIHSVNGRQALRIARSRYTTSDFDRAQRQHQIIQALKNRVSELGARDVRTITQLAILGFDSTETDLDLKSSLNLYRKYRNYDIANSVVLSTGNILESTYTGSINSTNQSELDELQNRGAYILLPKNNDWSIIRTFVQGFIRN